MKVESSGAVFSTVFVDYDNIYLSLKRKNEEAAKRFAKDSALWLREIENGRLITPTNGSSFQVPRRIVMSRCYGNPVPRRNATDNSTDMNSFPFIRHHFLRAGFEVIDCPPLTAQLKNSADIRMVMDVRDVLNHETRFDEFIILSGDADFTPVLHRLRAHARRTVVFANDHTAQPYTAISDGEIREADLITLLLEGRIGGEGEARQGGDLRALSSAELEVVRKGIVAEVVAAVRSAQQPVPLEALADRAVRVLGYDKTVGSSWGGAGTFRDLLAKGLPQDVKLSEQPPYVAYEPTRQIARDIGARVDAPAVRERKAEVPEPRYEPRGELPAARRADPRADFGEGRLEPRFDQRGERPMTERESRPAETRYEAQRYAPRGELGEPGRAAQPEGRSDLPLPRYDRMPPMGRGDIGRGDIGRGDIGGAPSRAPEKPALPVQGGNAYGRAPAAPVQPQQSARSTEHAAQIQQSIARIHEACQAPPLSPPEYRVLFEVMAEEITANNLSGQQTLVNIVQRARDMGLEVRRDDVRFVLEVVSEADPWFEQGASANLFASRFRNFVVARCRSQGLNLSADEIDLIDAWFGGAPAAQRAPQSYGAAAPAEPSFSGPAPADRWASGDDRRPQAQPQSSSFGAEPEDEFPRIVRSRLRG
jgi:hypothetical protein